MLRFPGGQLFGKALYEQCCCQLWIVKDQRDISGLPSSRAAGWGEQHRYPKSLASALVHWPHSSALRHVPALPPCVLWSRLPAAVTWVYSTDLSATGLIYHPGESCFFSLEKQSGSVFSRAASKSGPIMPWYSMVHQSQKNSQPRKSPHHLCSCIIFLYLGLLWWMLQLVFQRAAHPPASDARFSESAFC